MFFLARVIFIQPSFATALAGLQKKKKEPETQFLVAGQSVSSTIQVCQYPQLWVDPLSFTKKNKKTLLCLFLPSCGYLQLQSEGRSVRSFFSLSE